MKRYLFEFFTPKYEILKGKEKVVRELEKSSKKAGEVILATDPDREGEAIAWHLAEALGLKYPKRIVIHEITKEAVQESLKHSRSIDTNLRKAQVTLLSHETNRFLIGCGKTTNLCPVINGYGPRLFSYLSSKNCSAICQVPVE